MVRYGDFVRVGHRSAAIVTFAAYFFDDGLTGGPTSARSPGHHVKWGRIVTQSRIAAEGLVFSVISHVCVSCVFLFSLKAVTDTPFSFTAVFWISRSFR